MSRCVELVATVCDPIQGLMTRTMRLQDQLQRHGVEVAISCDSSRSERTVGRHVHIVDVARRIEEDLALPQCSYTAGFSRMVALSDDARVVERLQDALRGARAILASNPRLVAYARTAAPHVPVFWVRDGCEPFSRHASREMADRVHMLAAVHEHRLLFAGTLRAAEPLRRFAELIARLRLSGVRVKGVVAGPLETPAAVANLRSLRSDLIDYVGAWDRADMQALISACAATVQLEDGWSVSALAHEAACMGAPLLLQRSVARLITENGMAEAVLRTNRVCHAHPLLSRCKQALAALSDESCRESFGLRDLLGEMRISQMDEVKALISVCDENDPCLI
ncbi:glycosyltransferase family 9 protein [Ferroacidibacillus organovorans]|nr:glycosyltransferase family 9 protein [Ferroacidibacillus organovorans]